jgi:hypothetical protein
VDDYLDAFFLRFSRWAWMAAASTGSLVTTVSAFGTLGTLVVGPGRFGLRFVCRFLDIPSGPHPYGSTTKVAIRLPSRGNLACNEALVALMIGGDQRQEVAT